MQGTVADALKLPNSGSMIFHRPPQTDGPANGNGTTAVDAKVITTAAGKLGTGAVISSEHVNQNSNSWAAFADKLAASRAVFKASAGVNVSGQKTQVNINSSTAADTTVNAIAGGKSGTDAAVSGQKFNQNTNPKTPVKSRAGTKTSGRAPVSGRKTQHRKSSSKIVAKTPIKTEHIKAEVAHKGDDGASSGDESDASFVSAHTSPVFGTGFYSPFTTFGTPATIFSKSEINGIRENEKHTGSVQKQAGMASLMSIVETSFAVKAGTSTHLDSHSDVKQTTSVNAKAGVADTKNTVGTPMDVKVLRSASVKSPRGVAGNTAGTKTDGKSTTEETKKATPSHAKSDDKDGKATAPKTDPFAALFQSARKNV